VRMARTQGVLDWFRPPESKTLRPVWWDYASMGKFPRMELWAALYGQRARVFIRGRCTLIEVGYRLGRLPSAITKGIPRSTDLLAAPHRNLGEKLVPEARQVFRSLDEVVRGILRSLGLCIRSRGPLAGRRGFWQVGST
jgi:hypothetical protein